MQKSIHSQLRLWGAMLLMLNPVRAEPSGYSSIYVFGDGVSTTTQNPPPEPASLFNGARFCDGLVWIEVLSQALGVDYVGSNNLSYYGHYSDLLVANVANMSVNPPDGAAESLFIVWCGNADFVKFISLDDIPPNQANIGLWESAIAQSINNHVAAITSLHEDIGAKVIVIPKAVDIMKVPLFNYYSGDKGFVRARIDDFNDDLEAAMAVLMAQNPGLTIIMPDVFTFLDTVLTDPAAYGMVNPFPENAAILNEEISSPWVEGIHFVFWDDQHPTAKFQAALASFVNGQIPPLDTAPPVLALPGNLAKTSNGPEGAVVTFVVSAEDAVDGPVTATALPASGSMFPIGTTTVNVSASDAAGNVANESFKVTVVDMGNLLQNVTITSAGAGWPSITGTIQGGPPDGQVVLQASTDLGLVDPWRDLSTIALDAGGNQSFGPVEDPQGGGLKRDFFRIKLPLSP